MLNGIIPTISPNILVISIYTRLQLYVIVFKVNFDNALSIFFLAKKDDTHLLFFLIESKYDFGVVNRVLQLTHINEINKLKKIKIKQSYHYNNIKCII